MMVTPYLTQKGLHDIFMISFATFKDVNSSKKHYMKSLKTKISQSLKAVRFEFRIIRLL